MAQKYYQMVDAKTTIRLREYLEKLPDFCTLYFTSIETSTATRTKMAYAYDIHTFLKYLSSKKFGGKPIQDISLADIDKVNAFDIEKYLSFLRYYTDPTAETETMRSNEAKALRRHLSSLRSLLSFLYGRELIHANPASIVKNPKLPKKEIIRMDANETADFLDNVESGNGLTKKELQYHKKSALRDEALLSLMLGTGIRVSECVGLNISDVDLDEGGIFIHRKGNKEMTVYFGDEVKQSLSEYIAERKKIIAKKGDEDALFLSLQNSRMSVRSVERMVKKYAAVTTPLKHITPHKLRSTYGTALYQETGDIYLTADVLGHSNINVTAVYAEQDSRNRRMAANKVKLRET